MYHWRVLPDTGLLPTALAETDRVVASWDDRRQIRHRIEAVRDSSASIALFLEYIPQTLHQWLNVQMEAGTQAFSAEKVAFFAQNQSYDRSFTSIYLVNWLLTALYGSSGRTGKNGRRWCPPSPRASCRRVSRRRSPQS